MLKIIGTRLQGLSGDFMDLRIFRWFCIIKVIQVARLGQCECGGHGDVRDTVRLEISWICCQHHARSLYRTLWSLQVFCEIRAAQTMFNIWGVHCVFTSCTALYYTVMYCTVMYCTALYDSTRGTAATVHCTQSGLPWRPTLGRIYL